MLRIAFVLAVAGGLSCRDPRAEANIAVAMMEVGTTLSELRQDVGDLYNQVDSLRSVMARQDTIIRQLANLAGMPVPSR